MRLAVMTLLALVGCASVRSGDEWPVPGACRPGGGRVSGDAFSRKQPVAVPVWPTSTAALRFEQAVHSGFATCAGEACPRRGLRSEDVATH